METMLTRWQSAGLLAERAEERDQIQANLLDLDGTFGKRVLAGVSLADPSRAQCAAAAQASARDVLWPAPCDLAAADEAAASYRDAIFDRRRGSS